MQRTRRMDRLAPSIRRAHARVTWTWYASLVHGALLLALAAHLALRDDPAWILAGVAVVGGCLAPFLGRTAYRGNSFSALLLFAAVLTPPIVSFLRGWDPTLPLAGLVFAPVYYLGIKGATGLRGRRASKRSSR